MPILTPKTTVIAGDTSPWTDTDGVANIAVGVKGARYSIELNLGSDIVYKHGGADQHNEPVIVAKANQVRVVNRGTDSLDYEVFT